MSEPQNDRTIGVYVKVTAEERETLRDAAKKYGMTITDTVIGAVRFMAAGQRVACSRCAAVKKAFDATPLEELTDVE